MVHVEVLLKLDDPSIYKRDTWMKEAISVHEFVKNLGLRDINFLNVPKSENTHAFFSVSIIFCLLSPQNEILFIQ